MNTRPFDWRDLPALRRHRNQTVFLDTAMLLTRGPTLFSGVLLATLTPPVGVFSSLLTYVCNGCDDCEHTLIGQHSYTPGSQVAHLTFLTPDAALETSSFPGLLDYMATSAGERGVFRLLAEVDEHSPAFDALRQASFAIYSRQRIWQLTGQPAGEQAKPFAWRFATSRDIIAIRSLYNNVVPGIVQQVEPFQNRFPRGLVYQQNGELLAYAEVKYGQRGVWVHPFVHPDAEDVTEWFVGLLQNLPYRRSRPVYLCVRSYQSWLELAIEDIGAEAGPRQAVMVKHLAIPQRSVRAFAIPALEGGHPEVTAPIIRSETK